MTSQQETQCRIRAAGLVQSVIASGAPIEEWRSRSIYGLTLTSHLTSKLMKQDSPEPKIPMSLMKENYNG